MIRIHRTHDVPARLSRSTRRAEHERDYLASPEAYASGEKTFTFDRDVYADQEVKAALVAMQHEKCAFCESKPLATASGDVEHFRPKACVRSAEDGPVERPGYYWLAYTWENLVFACERCNRREKRNRFPLAAPRTSARTHAHGIAEEEPMFIDPSSEDPAPHIGFRKHMPYALTPRGRATIQGLGLGRRELAGDREEHVKKLFDTFRIAEYFPSLPERERAGAIANLAHALSDDGEYAAMNRTAVAAWRQRMAEGLPLLEP